MPTKLKPSVKTYNRKTGKTTTEHFYMKTMSKESLFEYINDDNEIFNIVSLLRLNRNVEMNYLEEVSK